MSLGIFLMYACLLETLINNSGPFINGRPIPRPYRKLMLSKTYDEARQRIHTRSVTKGNSEGESVDLSELDLPTLCSKDRNSDASCNTLLESLAWHKEQQEVRERIARAIRKGKKEPDGMEDPEKLLCPDEESRKDETCRSFLSVMAWNKKRSEILEKIEDTKAQNPASDSGRSQNGDNHIKDVTMQESDDGYEHEIKPDATEDYTDNDKQVKTEQELGDESKVKKITHGTANRAGHGTEDGAGYGRLENGRNTVGQRGSQKAQEQPRIRKQVKSENRSHENDDMYQGSDFKRECENGNEDKAACDSHDKWLKWKENHDIMLAKISKEQGQSRGKRQVETVADDPSVGMKKDCEEGETDKATCDSYFNWLKWNKVRDNALENRESTRNSKAKEAKSEDDDRDSEEVLSNEKHKEKRSMKNEEESDSLFSRHSKKISPSSNTESGSDKGYDTSLKEECDNGEVDKVTCDQYYEWLKWKKSHIKRVNTETASSNQHSDKSRGMEQSTGTTERLRQREERSNDEKPRKDVILDEKESSEVYPEEGTDESIGSKENSNEEDQIVIFKKSCEEGKEDKEICNAFLKWLKENVESEVSTQKEKREADHSEIGNKDEEAEKVSEFMFHKVDENNDGKFGRTIPSEKETST